MSVEPASPIECDVGDVVHVPVSLRQINLLGVKIGVDPATLIYYVKMPSNEIDTYTFGVDPEVVKDAVGDFHLDFIALMSGDHYVKCITTGNAKATGEILVRVRKQEITPP